MGRHRRLHRRERKHKNKVIVISLFGLILLLSCGYAAFQTQISINAKGTIKKTAEECFTVTDNGDGTGTITDYDESCGTKVTIPDIINNLTITKIGDATWTGTTYDGVFSQKNITYVKLPSSLTYIGEGAFFLDSISVINIPESVTTIGSNAFRANKLTTLQLSENIKEIGSRSFLGNELTEITIPTSVISLGGGAFTCNNITGDDAYIYGRNNDGTIDYTTLSSYANKTLDVLSLNEQTITIDSSAFEEVSFKNTDLILPDSITTINSHAFSYTNIISITISNNINYIEPNTHGSGSFSYITSLKTININRKENAISGSPWGATNATVNWTGTE